MRHYIKSTEPLTETEKTVVRTMLAGHTENGDIADALGIRRATVQTHLSNIYSKLYVSNRVDLCLYALRCGWFNCFGEPQGGRHETT